MKKTKKIIALVLCLVLAIGAVSGTLAYLTDRDSEVNTFTVGDVKIDLHEEFVQASQLMPGVDVKKEVTIENTGKNDAWVWFTYAVPAALKTVAGDNRTADVIHCNLPGRFWANADKEATDGQYYLNEKYWAEGQTEAVAWEKTWNVNNSQIGTYTDESGIEYNVYVVKYNGKLAAGETTSIGLSKVYLDTHVDYNVNDGKYYWIDNGNAELINFDLADTKIYVSAYAIQADGFDTVEEAYAAYQAQWGANGTEYAEVPAAPSVSPDP